MQRYRVKSSHQESTVMDVLAQDENELKIRITRSLPGKTYVEETVMSRDLFAMCRRTGYIRAVSAGVPRVA